MGLQLQYATFQSLHSRLLNQYREKLKSNIVRHEVLEMK